MRPRLRVPAGQITANTLGGGVRYHKPLDNSCSCLDSESFPDSEWHFTGQLLDDMRSRSLSWLAKAYPELIFGWSEGSAKPKGVDYYVSRRGGYRTATWRTL